MSGAGEALQRAAVAVLQDLQGLSGVYPGPPLQAAFPHAVVEAGFELDWSHKSGKGREVRLYVTLRDAGELPGRIQGLAPDVEAALDSLGAVIEGWKLVSFQFMRSRTISEPERKSSAASWTTVLEYRARLLADAA